MNTVSVYTIPIQDSTIVDVSALNEPAASFEIPFMQSIDPKTTDEEIAKRFHLGDINGITISRNLFGSVFAGQGDVVLCKGTWQEIEGVFMSVRAATPPPAPIEAVFSRLWRWLLRSDCKHCRRFDHEEGLKWRHRETHKFDDGSTAAMWDDVMSIVAKDNATIVIPDSFIGYCSLRECILDGRNPPCEDFTRG